NADALGRAAVQLQISLVSFRSRRSFDRFFCTPLPASRRIGLACLPIPILIGFSRMYIGAHYLSDVVCAAVLGILCALLVTHFLLRQIEDRQSQVETEMRRG